MEHTQCAGNATYGTKMDENSFDHESNEAES